MKGVNVKMIMSFDVNTVSTDTAIKRYVKSLYWFPPDFPKTTFAQYLNTPISSKKID